MRQDLKKSRLYGARLISEGIGVMEQFARRGAVIKRLYATTRTRDGIKLSRDMGFKQVTPVAEEDDLLRFELDLETSTNPLFQKYQSIAKRASAAVQKSKISRSQPHKLEI